jgi:IS30 family transposase
MGRHPSTIGRELTRNTVDETIGYLPDEASSKANKRIARHGHKLKRQPDLEKIVVNKLKDGWSPDAIAGRMKLQGNSSRISRESIYQWIYSSEGNEQKLYEHLLSKKTKRGNFKGRKHRKTSIPERVSIHERPDMINDRSVFGHYESDLTFTRGSQSTNLATVVERKTKFTFFIKNDSKKTTVVMKNIFNKIAQLPAYARRSMTFDNGTEFTRHTVLKKGMNMKTYFCDPRSPWQKGQVEKTNAMLHRYIPKKKSLKQISPDQINLIEKKMNDTPRRILGFKTPSEAFFNELKFTSSRPLNTHGAGEPLPLRGTTGGDTHVNLKIALHP